MKNENKCFFSISLENGITITGANPYEVREFLRLLNLGMYWAAEHYEKKRQTYLMKKAYQLDLETIHAINTITKNLNKEEE